MVDLIFVAALFWLAFVPAFVTIVEYSHGWAKLYNKVVVWINKTFHTNIDRKNYKEEPNSNEHEKKTFKKWFLIGLVPFAITVLLIIFS